MRGSIFFLVGLVLAMFCAACTSDSSGHGQAMQAQAYPVKTMSPETVELQDVFPALLKGKEDIDIKPRVDGFIEAVYVDEGAKVKKGQALFKINSPSTVKALEEARANYSTAKIDVERMRPLAEKNIISKVKLETYENAFAAAKAALEQAEANMTWITVTSPVEGVLGTISYRLGSLVDNSNVLTTVANTTTVMAYFSMNEKDLYDFMLEWKGETKAEKIKNMPDVKFRLSNGREYEEPGRIETISGVVDKTTGAVSFRAAFPNKNGLLLSGTSGKILIPKVISNALVIPQKATFSQQDKIMIYKVLGDSVMQDVVKVKSTPDGRSYVVFDGLESGDKIVTDGIATLSNGKKIKVQ
ncbi:efflux transporter, RND family, MFP subunit [Chloroherpeton thalassium ATCC 35110]|uniref:Efflux transporter, RND family, MFP subunit n=1 Tax=Chloroherpeton thalassium (strain ATCC 35110 / GB-78) TaxID=517418 RepID=B3QT39_CHLT3|nr:efflux RND transporter periplasmic adaptor subunit [Chloroherpeton thalassium]ACF14138.1 efflux transporter, RND family, MFP subunit [Chloroherpeton thalassium ATCC 35110]